MTIHEIHEQDYELIKSSHQQKFAIYLFTSLCGTCKLGERMLEIIDTMDNHIPLYKMNINYAPNLRVQWQIASVPCLVVIQNDIPEQFIYAMRSVDYLFDILRY